MMYGKVKQALWPFNKIGLVILIFIYPYIIYYCVENSFVSENTHGRAKWLRNV